MSDVVHSIEGSESATIMMVDDEPTTLEVLEILLHEEGYRNFVSTNESTRALELLRQERPDLLLLNLMMPGIGGLEILDSMRKDESLRHIPVVILTSSTDPDIKRRALGLGADDFLSKPVDPSELALRLRNTFAAAGRPELVAAREAGASLGRTAAADGPPIASRLDQSDPRYTVIIRKFIMRLEIAIETMEASFERGDLEELASLAHWLKGAAGTVGFDVFTGPAETLRNLAEARKRDEIEPAIAEIRELTSRIDVPARGEP